MEIKLSEKQLDSTYFRVLFELAKKEGPESLQKLLKDLEMLKGNSLEYDAIFKGRHYTLSLTTKNKGVISYLRERKKELVGLNLLNESVTASINELVDNPGLLDTYLETAKYLEDYRIGHINCMPECLDTLNITSRAFYDKEGKINCITKHYTDGSIIYSPVGEPQGLFRQQIIPCILDGSVPTTWVLRTENSDSGWQYRTIYLENFAFDTTKLPTEEEVQSYDLPPSLKLYLGK